jgi:hypothetical protein
MNNRLFDTVTAAVMPASRDQDPPPELRDIAAYLTKRTKETENATEEVRYASSGDRWVS